MKVFKDGATCFSCGWNGDQFAFVQKMEGCSFKYAYMSLGGTYEKHDTEAERQVIKARYERNRKEREQAEQAERDFRLLLARTITSCRELIENTEPYSDAWCEAQNYIPVLIGAWEEYTEQKEIRKIDVIRICKRFERFRSSL